MIVRLSRRCALGVVGVLTLAAAVIAHDFSTSESVLQIDGSIVRSRLSINLLTLGGVDVNGDERISYDELDRAIERVFLAIKDHYRIDSAGEPAVSVNADRSEIVEDHVLQIDLRYVFNRPVTTIMVMSTLDQMLGPSHQHVVSMKVGDVFHREVLDGSHGSARFDARRFTATRLAAVFFGLLGVAALVSYRRRNARARTAQERAAPNQREG